MVVTSCQGASLSRVVVALVALVSLALGGCATAKEIRIHNVSTYDFSGVSIADRQYGEIAAGDASDYQSVPMRFRYAILRLTADGYTVNGQTLNLGSKRLTYRVDVIDLAAGHLAIEVVRD